MMLKSSPSGSRVDHDGLTHGIVGIQTAACQTPSGFRRNRSCPETTKLCYLADGLLHTKLEGKLSGGRLTEGGVVGMLRIAKESCYLFGNISFTYKILSEGRCDYRISRPPLLPAV